MDDGRRLAAALHTAPEELAHLGRLPQDAVRRLEEAVRAAVAREEAAIDRCMEDALHVVPRPLRRPLRRILGVDEP